MFVLVITLCALQLLSVAFLAEEMADGRHGVFDGQLLRWSDGSTWRRVDEQSGVHQAIFCESTAKKIIVELYTL